MKCISQVHFFHKLTPSFVSTRASRPSGFPCAKSRCGEEEARHRRRRGPRPTHAPAGGESRQPRRSRSNSQEIRARWDWSNASPESISSPAGISSESRSRRPNGGWPRPASFPCDTIQRRPAAPIEASLRVKLAQTQTGLSLGEPRPHRERRSGAESPAPRPAGC